MAAWNLYAQVNAHINDGGDNGNIYAIGSSICVLLSYLYTTILVLLSRRYQLPNTFGWILNVNLCFI